LFAEWEKKDPITRFEKQLVETNNMTEDEIKQMEKEITVIIDDAVDWADNQPYPDPEDCLKDVYFEG
ncbi:MAG: thiamine pyrophosphate-dependent enzyme, partial [bacterium]|nr:thiamine pyrophosphate-dependent enzyme [bacterium]